MECVRDFAIHTNKLPISCVGITFAAMATVWRLLIRRERDREMGTNGGKEIEREGGEACRTGGRKWMEQGGNKGGGEQLGQPECQPDKMEGEVFEEEE